MPGGAQAARWKGHPPHRTTGVPRPSASQRAPGSAMLSAISGIQSAAETIRRTRSARAGASRGPAPVLRDAGTAEYPAAPTASHRSASLTRSGS